MATGDVSVEELARQREREAFDLRYKHGKAARTWAAIVGEQPRTGAVSRILAEWMGAYEDADAKAEAAFRALAAEEADRV